MSNANTTLAVEIDGLPSEKFPEGTRTPPSNDIHLRAFQSFQQYSGGDQDDSRNSRVKGISLLTNEKPLNSDKKVNDLVLQVEQLKKFYEEGKQVWMKDLQNMQKYILALNGYVDAHNSRLERCLEIIEDEMTLLRKELVQSINVIKKDSSAELKSAFSQKGAQIMSKMEPKLFKLIDDLKQAKFSIQANDPNKILRTLDSGIQQTMTKVEKLFLSHNPNQSDCIRLDTNESAQFNNVISTAFAAQFSGKKIAPESPAKLNAILKNNLMHSAHCFKRKTEETEESEEEIKGMYDSFGKKMLRNERRGNSIITAGLDLKKLVYSKSHLHPMKVTSEFENLLNNIKVRQNAQGGDITFNNDGKENLSPKDPKSSVILAQEEDRTNDFISVNALNRSVSNGNFSSSFFSFHNARPKSGEQDSSSFSQKISPRFGVSDSDNGLDTFINANRASQHDNDPSTSKKNESDPFLFADSNLDIPTEVDGEKARGEIKVKPKHKLKFCGCG